VINGGFAMKRKLSLLALVGALLLLANPAWGAPGALLWEQTITFNPDTTTAEVNSMVVSSTRFIITGRIKPISQALTTGPVGFIKAFDVATGTPRWDKTLTEGYSNSIVIMALDRDLLIAKEISFTSHSLDRTTLKCYIADTGQQLWAVPMDYVQSPVGGVFSIVASNRVYSVVIPVDPVGNQTGTIVVRTYQERDLPAQTLLLLLE
jgi:hypothetical protein